VPKVQRQLDEPALIGANGIFADFDFVEPDLARFPPGEHVEEAAELSAIRGSQIVEDLSGPGWCARLGDRLDRWGREPFGPQLAGAVGIHPDAAPAVVSQVIHHG